MIGAVVPLRIFLGILSLGMLGTLGTSGSDKRPGPLYGLSVSVCSLNSKAHGDWKRLESLKQKEKALGLERRVAYAVDV